MRGDVGGGEGLLPRPVILRRERTQPAPLDSLAGRQEGGRAARKYRRMMCLCVVMETRGKVLGRKKKKMMDSSSAQRGFDILQGDAGNSLQVDG